MSRLEEDIEKKDWDEEDISPEQDEDSVRSGKRGAADTAVQALNALKQSMKKSRTPKRKKRRKKVNPFLVLLIIILLGVGTVLVLNSGLFTIKHIVVEGNRYYTPAQVIEMSGIESGKNLYFELKAKAARNKLLSSPYIKVASIERVPVSTVKIVIEERLEYAAISTDEGFVIIDADGTILRISEQAPDVTVMEGMDPEDPQEGKPVKVRQTYLFSETLRLLAATEDMDLYFKKVYFSAAVVRAYLGENYYCEGTPENIFKSLSALKELAEQHYAQGINKGVIKVGTDGYLSFSPKID